jgi:hypothetical protein
MANSGPMTRKSDYFTDVQSREPSEYDRCAMLSDNARPFINLTQKNAADFL